MSYSPAPSKRRQYSSDVASNWDSEDDFSTRESQWTTSSREISCVSSLSELGQKFVHVKLGDYMRCETFIRKHPKILKEDPTEFLRVTKAALVAGERQLAKQCVQRYVLIRGLQDSSNRGRKLDLHHLAKGTYSDSGFVEECKEVFKKVEEKIFDFLTIQDPTCYPYVESIVPSGSIMADAFQNQGRHPRIDTLNSIPRTHRYESSSRLSPLGHLLIRIPVNQYLQSGIFLKRNPEILDEDHELYISEALSALRRGNESVAQSAIEKSIILRDFDRRRPEYVFLGLSQSVRSAMSILMDRVNKKRFEDLSDRTQSSILPLQSRSSNLSDLSCGDGGRSLVTSRSPYTLRADEGDRLSVPGGFLQHTHMELPRVQTAERSVETIALKTSILHLRKENEAAEQELQNTRRVVRDQMQEVASTKQELEAAKQEVQEIRQELTHGKQELTIRLEELQSTREELQNRKKELKGSEGQKQALQQEKKKIEAAKKLQMLRDDELREKEKELTKTKMELDRERESIAQARHEIEAMRRLRGFENTTISIPATAELPETISLPIGIQATMEDKETQTTAVCSFDNPAEFEMPRSENESDINGLRYGSTVFGLLQSAATVFKNGIQQQQASVVSSSSNVLFIPNDDSTSFTATDYLLETDTPTPATTEDEGEDKDARALKRIWDRRRRKNEVIQGLNFRFKEVETREADVEAKELQVQFDQDKVKRQREIQRQRDRAAFARQCHGCGIALALGFEFPE